MGQAYLFGNENEVSESLRNSLSVVTKPSQEFYKTRVKTPTALLSRDYRTSSAKYSTPIKRLQYSYQETTGLRSRNYRTPIKREATALQHYRTLFSKMIECLSLIFLFTLVTLLGATDNYLYSLLKIRIKRILMI